MKSWLFTTTYRLFLTAKRHEGRFPHLAINSVEHELPTLSASAVDRMDAAIVLDALLGIEEHYRTPLTLFYLHDLSYREIAKMLEIPVGTVMSRLSRAKTALRERVLERRAGNEETNIVAIDAMPQPKAR